MALASPATSPAQSRREIQDYGRGTNMFANRTFEPAAESLSNFVATYTNSALRTDAILYLARSQIELSNYTGALELLKREMPAGKLAPDFVFWMATAYYGTNDYTNAIERCAFLLQNYSAAPPPLPLRAALLQARALAQLSQWTPLIALLSQPDGVFQAAARGGPSDQDVVDGYFLLVAAYLNQQQDKAAEIVLGKINTNGLRLDLQWQRQDLLCQVFLDEGRLEEALEGSTNLLAFLPQASQDQRIATAFLRGKSSSEPTRFPKRCKLIPTIWKGDFRTKSSGRPWPKRLTSSCCKTSPPIPCNGWTISSSSAPTNRS